MKVLRCPGTIRRRCRYELPETGFAESGEIVCPECGRRYADASQLLLRIRFKRNVWTLIALVLLILVAGAGGSIYVYTLDWPEDYPTAILIYQFPEHGIGNTGVYQELFDRASDGSLSMSHQRMLIEIIETRLESRSPDWWALVSLATKLDAGTPQTVARVIETHPRSIVIRDAQRVILWMGTIPSKEVVGELVALAEGEHRLGFVYHRGGRSLPPGPTRARIVATGEIWKMRSHLTPGMLERLERLDTSADPALELSQARALGRCLVCGDDVEEATSEVCRTCLRSLQERRGGG